MKFKNLLLSGALPLALFAACSSDDAPNTGGNQIEQTPDGYIAVNLQLPTSTATRADDKLGEGSGLTGTNNDIFDDGKESEYSVESGILLLFQGPKDGAESDAKFVGAFDLGFPRTPEGENIQNPNVTTNYQFAVKVTGLNLGANDNLYGLVMLNPDCADVTLSEGNGVKIGDTDFSIDNNKTFKDLVGLSSQKSFVKVNNPGGVASKIFMCNAPMANYPGGIQNPKAAENTNFKVTTLVNLSKELKATPQEALDNPAGTIYVERAVAKVTLSSICEAKSISSDGIKTGIEMVNNGTATPLYITNVEWALGNEEERSFYVRNVGDATNTIDWGLASENTLPDANSGKYRMVSGSALLANINKNDKNDLVYRTYWCFDPHYNINKYDGDIDGQDPAAKLGTLLSWKDDQIFYPHENTFDVEHMTYRNTTRVGLWITMALGEKGTAKTFYTRNANKTTIYFDDEKGNNPLVNNVLADLSENSAVKGAWEKAVVNQSGTGSYTDNAANLITVSTEVGRDGCLKVTGIAFKERNDLYGEGKLPDFDFTTLISNFNLAYQFYEYTGGKVFYEFRIKHFGDDLTPWSASTLAGNIGESYGTEANERDNNYLGRYGMVRNNWYDITINQLLNLGDPRDPATWDDTWGDTPDDNKDQYIALDIAVLSWAKRLQSVDF